MPVSSLFDLALQAVLRDVHRHEPELCYLPSLVKTRIAKVMAKRGLLSERNMALVLHDAVVDLDLSDCEVSPLCVRLLWALCPRLRCLHLGVATGCRNTITSQALSQLFMHCTRLQILSLRCCVLVDNSSLLCLVRSCPLLASLCVAGCHMVSDRGVVGVGEYCQYLRALDLSRTKVSGDGLLALANGPSSKHLKELNISHCLNVTDEPLQTLCANCPRLSILVCHSCPLLTSQSRDTVGKMGLKHMTWTVY